MRARLLTRPSSPQSVRAEPQPVLPLVASLTQASRRTLTFDIENRPLSYWYEDASTAEVTVIAHKWADKPTTEVLLTGYVGATVHSILEDFRPVYDEAEVLVGHNIRKHDLPILNGAYIELGFPPLAPKLTIDTLRDLTRWKDIPRSLEYLADWLGCPLPKYHMSQHSWREANRFTRDGLALARQRCATDVEINEWCHRELVRRGLITKPPRIWSP